MILHDPDDTRGGNVNVNRIMVFVGGMRVGGNYNLNYEIMGMRVGGNINLKYEKKNFLGLLDREI
jgi:hypothetical protein